MRRHISRKLKELALRMLLEHGIPDALISKYTDISTRSLERLRKTYHDTGEVVNVPLTLGRPRTLDALNANMSFLEACIEQQPDMTLDEL
ncbi:hypothetical protein BC835DRAFT_1234289, partial [Cytidiella melzeri]